MKKAFYIPGEAWYKESVEEDKPTISEFAEMLTGIGFEDKTEREQP